LFGKLTVNRQELFKSFQETGALREANEWYSLAHDLLVLLQQNWHQSSAAEPVKKVLELHVKRMQRYFFALLRMSADLGERNGWIHLVDGSHAVQKCLYEVYVEYALCLVYWELFGIGKNHEGDDLYDRLKRYAAFEQRKGNYERLHRQEEWNKLRKDVSGIVDVPPEIVAHMDAGPAPQKIELERQAQLLHGEDARMLNVKHWFPQRKSKTEYFVKPSESVFKLARSQGSMEWRCKAVLAQHFPDKDLRPWWASSYDQDYDFLNAHDHPALGYEENFLPEGERLFELARLQVGARFGFHRAVVPSLRCYFRDVWGELVLLEDHLTELDRKISEKVLLFELKVQGLTPPS
jgi:hypothetical protein